MIPPGFLVDLHYFKGLVFAKSVVKSRMSVFFLRLAYAYM